MKKNHYPVVPPGQYRVKFKNQYNAFSKDQKKPTKRLIFEIETGPYVGETLLATFLIDQVNSIKLLDKVFSFLSGGNSFKNPTELIGKSVGVNVVINEFGKYDAANSIKRYFPVK